MKTATFQLLIRKNQKKLVEAGLNQYTVRSWAYGYRTPDFNHALIIAQTLGIDIQKIPYRQIFFNRP